MPKSRTASLLGSAGRTSFRLATFDSAAAMVRALARYLRGEDYPALGAGAKSFSPWSEGIAPERLGAIRAERIAAWIVGQYPKRPYSAVLIGSSNGAAVHLGVALGIPWLPQTCLIPVRRGGIPPDEPKRDMQWAREPAEKLLAANPQWTLHQMNDANQNRLMLRGMSGFRVKRTRLGAAYERFLEHNLQPGATLFVVECGLRWPTVGVADRHIFQHGALGGATSEEYRHGGPRVRGVSRTVSFLVPAMGRTRAGRRSPRGRVGLRAGPPRGRRAVCASRAIASAASSSSSPKTSARWWPTSIVGGIPSGGCRPIGCWSSHTLA